MKLVVSSHGTELDLGSSNGKKLTLCQSKTAIVTKADPNWAMESTFGTR